MLYGSSYHDSSIRRGFVIALVLWLNANFRTGLRVRLIYKTRRNKFSTAYMSFNSYINKNHKGLFEDFRGQNV